MYLKFSEWLDRIIEKNDPIDAAALSFNLYEDENSNWSIQLIGASDFDEDDDDWACDEVFSTKEDLLSWKQKADWKEILNTATRMIEEYLDKGKYADKLKNYKAIATGFVDGDLAVIYKK